MTVALQAESAVNDANKSGNFEHDDDDDISAELR